MQYKIYLTEELKRVYHRQANPTVACFRVSQDIEAYFLIMFFEFYEILCFAKVKFFKSIKFTTPLTLAPLVINSISSSFLVNRV